jgi:thioester reductase-like protein
MSGSFLLLTGASGLVGSSLLPVLLRARPERRVIVLSRAARETRLVENRRVSMIYGDLTRDGLDLNSATQTDLTQSVTEIVHCAADIRFRSPLEQARETNTAGTVRLLALARRCRRLERFAHVSTVYVAGRQRGAVREERLSGHAGFLNPYQQSKHEAEQAVFEAMPEIPACIFRLSSIISDSKGAVSQFNYFHQVLKLAERNPLPMIPGDRDAPLDLIASDWAASALALLHDFHFTPGRVRHVCTGPEASMTVGEILHWTFQMLNARRPNPAPAPRLVSADEFEEFARRQEGHDDAPVRELLRVVQGFLPQLAIRQHYHNRETLSILERSGLAVPPVREYYPRVVENCLGRGVAR